MNAPDSNAAAEFAAALLTHYSFDLSGLTASELINRWLKDYPAAWVRLAVIEALYQGRYKGVSVEQILAFWERRNQTAYHFNAEFERLVCGDILKSVEVETAPSEPAVNLSNKQQSPASAETALSIDALGDADPKNNHQIPTAPPNPNHPPIQQFTPAANSSDFYSKLKAISQQKTEEKKEENVTGRVGD